MRAMIEVEIQMRGPGDKERIEALVEALWNMANDEYLMTVGPIMVHFHSQSSAKFVIVPEKED